ncbi:hypothetical protein [Glacieibacterium frigidum]|uniref:Uncharacterized protein n=1 Tax=Glacieibacterium frigidum TaxID=2593303 RepID=A0A552UA86_9SPHN|nr:hypothetical protein [Glacieibacterium frigidum]TRW15123.1 hypothetical protein FMM06_15875 [Glacieibacterium frigidum]
MRAALVALLIATSALAAPKPSKIAITPASADAAVLVRAPRLPVTYTLGISRFDPVAQNLLTGTFSGGWVNMVIDGGAPGQSYVLRKLKPGTYVVRDVSQQEYWAVCFGDATRQFSVGPGQLLFLGDFDGATPIAELHANVRANPGHGSAKQDTIHHYLDKVTPPRLAEPDAVALAEAAAWLKAESPGTTVTPVAATLTPTKFGTGVTLFGQRACGGYFKKKVAEAPAQ